METYGYVRVSTKNQNEARQLHAMAEQNIPEKHIFVDKQSGKDFNRPAYLRLLKKLKPSDLVIIHSIDRLGRNYDEILEQWRIITKEKQADIYVLDFPLLDTRARLGERDLTGRFVSDLVLQILAYVAQKERESIHQRQAEGIAAAKARDVHFGRKAMERPKEFENVYAQWREGKLSAREAGRKLNVSHSTFLNWSKGNGKKKYTFQTKFFLKRWVHSGTIKKKNFICVFTVNQSVLWLPMKKNVLACDG